MTMSDGVSEEHSSPSCTRCLHGEESSSVSENIHRPQRPYRVVVYASIVATLAFVAYACHVNRLDLSSMNAAAVPNAPFRARNENVMYRALANGDDYNNADDGGGGGGNDDANNDDGAAAAADDAAAANDDKHEQYEGPEDDAPIYVDDDIIDDFYAFEEDPGPRRLLPLTAYDAFGFLLASMGVTLAAGGGIGGGGILLPVYIIVMGLPPREAIPLSAVTVMGGAMAATLKNAMRRHPIADRPVIDWDLILVMEPLILVGALIGTVLHRVLSEQLLVVMLVVMLSVVARSILIKAGRMHEAETKYIIELKTARSEVRQRREEQLRRESMSMDPVLQKINEETSMATPLPVRAAREKQHILLSNPDFSTLRSDLLDEEKVAPRNKILAICGMFSILIFLNIMVGGGAYISPWGIRCGGIAFWVVHAIMAGCLIACAWAAQTYLVNRHEIKELVRFDYVHGDIKWDSRSSIIYPLFFCSAGVFAGMFGIGGGMVTVPLMLAMGVHPAVATATSSCMTLFTSISATTSYVIFGLLMWDYAAVCLAVGFFACMFGQKIMEHAKTAGELKGRSQNFERNSVIAYSIGSVILLSALLMTVLYVLTIVSFDEDGDNGGMCEGYARYST